MTLEQIFNEISNLSANERHALATGVYVVGTMTYVDDTDPNSFDPLPTDESLTEAAGGWNTQKINQTLNRLRTVSLAAV